MNSIARAVFVVLLISSFAVGQNKTFQIEEMTINGLHRAIQNGETTCRQVVQAYIDRAKAYNGMCTALVTKDGAPIPPMTGVVRAGAPITFPTETVAVSKILPDLDQYRGLPIEFGRMETTISDPRVEQQYGMRVGIPEARQLNALETLNIRGERSVTCKGEFDKAPSAGPLPPGAPTVSFTGCSRFHRSQTILKISIENATGKRVFGLGRHCLKSSVRPRSVPQLES